jgi:uncharacterized protein with HEPN domain
MPRDKGDAAFIHDMLISAKAISRFLLSKTRDDFASDEMLRGAVERKLEIIGEAARQVSRTFQNSHPRVPWQKIVATRHVLAHDYDEVNEDIVWRIATVYVPELIGLIEPLVPPAPADPEPNE